MKPVFSRRSFLISGGALVVSFHLPYGRAQAGPAYDLDSFIAVHPDGDVTLATSHIDCGTGIRTAYLQIAAEELGVPIERFHFVEGDTAATPNHGGTGGSSGVPRGGADIRRAAATARQALLELAPSNLNATQSRLRFATARFVPSAAAKALPWQRWSAASSSILRSMPRPF